MEKPTLLNLISERGVYVSRDTCTISDLDDFTLSSDINLFAELSRNYKSFVALTASLDSAELHSLFQTELFNKLILSVRSNERNEAY